VFTLFRKSQPQHLTAVVTEALSTDFHQVLTRPPSSIVLQKGPYSGRTVSYFRVFDPIPRR